MTSELWDIVNEFRKEGIHVSDEEAEYIYRFCIRKMDVGMVVNKEEYLPLLYEDELRKHLMIVAINATTIMRMIRKGMIFNV